LLLNGAVAADVLSLRALGRATLARQLLLERAAMPALDAVRHLVGLQAQVPLNPYTGLWSRLEGFRPEELSELLETRRVVRIVVMRGTLHLVTADDALVLRPLVQPILDKELANHPDYGPPTRDVDFGPVLGFARALVAERPHSGGELRAAMAERFPEHDAASLAFACRNLLAFVQVPPRGVWGRTAQVTSTTAEAWLGRPLVERPPLDDVVLRYLAAFGPATVADVTAWSRLAGLRAVIERLRPTLRTFRDERGRELFDLPDAPRPDADTPAPPRFLPEYDNVLLSHADRSRIASDDDRRRLGRTGGMGYGAVLDDGVLWGTWRLDAAALHIAYAEPRPKRALAAVAAEGRRLLRFLGTEVRDVRLTAVD
jgi:hypothetical protein